MMCDFAAITIAPETDRTTLESMFTMPITEDFVRGTPYSEPTDRGLRPHRLPPHVRTRDADAQLTLMESHPSGVRLEFLTESTRIGLELHSTRVAYRGMERARGAVDVVVDGTFQSSMVLDGGDAIELDMATGSRTLVSGEADIVVADALPNGEKKVQIWLPHNEQVDLIALHSDAEVRPFTKSDRATEPVWLHYGSSISQGSNAAHPTGIWPVVAARRAGVNLHNLGFGGSAMVDPFMARLMQETPADLISVKLGINVVNLDGMRRRIFVPAVHGFLDTIRDGHPETPLLVVSPTHCLIHEDTPGPGGVDPESITDGEMRFIATGKKGDTDLGRLTLQSVREALAEVVEARSDDPNLHFLSGLDLFGAEDETRLPLPDGLHPVTEAHRLIGDRFADLVFGPDGVFGSSGGASVAPLDLRC